MNSNENQIKWNQFRPGHFSNENQINSSQLERRMFNSFPSRLERAELVKFIYITRLATRNYSARPPGLQNSAAKNAPNDPASLARSL